MSKTSRNYKTRNSLIKFKFTKKPLNFKIEIDPEQIIMKKGYMKHYLVVVFKIKHTTGRGRYATIFLNGI